jgi:hypothetical protein
MAAAKKTKLKTKTTVKAGSGGINHNEQVR